MGHRPYSYIQGLNWWNIPTKYGLIWYSTSILGSWNSHWSIFYVSLMGHKCVLPGSFVVTSFSLFFTSDSPSIYVSPWARLFPRKGGAYQSARWFPRLHWYPLGSLRWTIGGYNVYMIQVDMYPSLTSCKSYSIEHSDFQGHTRII
jgi:hypothetical protein